MSIANTTEEGLVMKTFGSDTNIVSADEGKNTRLDKLEYSEQLENLVWVW